MAEMYILRKANYKDNCLSRIHALAVSEDHPYAVEIKPYKPKRTDLQNRFLWGWVYGQLVQQLEDRGVVIRCEDDREIPYTKDILHEIFKTKFLCKANITTKKGNQLILYYSTTELTTKQFSDYVEKIKQLAFQFWNIEIPEPVGVYKTYQGELKRAA